MMLTIDSHLIDVLEGKLPTKTKAIRYNCLICCQSAAEVKACPITTCPLWPFRLGKTPTKSDIEEHFTAVRVRYEGADRKTKRRIEDKRRNRKAAGKRMKTRKEECNGG